MLFAHLHVRVSLNLIYFRPLPLQATGGDNAMTLQQMQLKQLQTLQQQLLQQTAMLSKVQGGDSKTGVDTQLLSSLEQLTKQLLVSKVCIVKQWSCQFSGLTLCTA